MKGDAAKREGAFQDSWILLLKVVEILIFNLKSGCYAVGDMAEDRKKAAAPEPPNMPYVGDKVTMKGSNSGCQISRVYPGDDEVDVEVPRTNLQWFRVKADTLTFVERQLPPKPPIRSPRLSLRSTPRLCWSASTSSAARA